MVYAVGSTKHYQNAFAKALQNGGSIVKVGRKKGYSGGTVWRTRKEAESYCKSRKGMSVYGVQASWRKDTAPSIDPKCPPGARDLLRDAALIEL